MRIELTDTIDVPYEVSTNITAEGNIIRISPQSANTNRDADYDICLNKDGAEELIRTLKFLICEIARGKRKKCISFVDGKCEKYGGECKGCQVPMPMNFQI